MRNLALSVVFVAGLAALPLGASAQVGPGGLIDPNRDCRTVTTCRFVKGGRYRGCVSSYSCRVCRFVTSTCKIGGSRGKCRRLRCSWGG